MGYRTIQQRFTVGELDPKMKGRFDAELYFNAVEKAQNVVGLTQGGIKRRDGTQFISRIPYSGESYNDNVRHLEFSFDTDETYTLIVTTGKIDVFAQGVYKTTITTPDITNEMIPRLKYTQSADTLILVESELAPKLVQRNSTDDTIWTYEDLEFENIPYYNFVPNIVTPPGTLTPSDVDGTITLTTSTGTFVPEDVGNVVQTDSNGGKCRILAYNSATSVEAVTIIPFYTDNTVAAGTWTIDTGYELVWSETRGYPITATFHQARLYFGGSKSRPLTIWGSNVNGFFNFDEGSLLADEGINSTLNTNQLNAIVNLKSKQTLQVFTTGGEFTVVQNAFDPITPTNFRVEKQSEYGSEPYLDVVENEGQTIFVQRNSKNIHGFLFNNDSQAYESLGLTIYNSHLVNNVVDVALRRSSSVDESAQYYIVKEDGNMTIGTLLTSQNVGSFTRIETDGDYLGVSVENQQVFVTVRRVINGEEVISLELFREDVNTDNALVLNAPTGTIITGLDHLEGKEVVPIADGSELLPKTVVNGSIEIERQAQNLLVIGLPFKILIQTLPVEIGELGALMSVKKRIYEVYFRLIDTQDLTVNNNNLISFRGFGPSGDGSPLDTAPPSYTGDKRYRGVLGWARDQHITITQNSNLDLTILAMGLRVKVGN